MRLGQAYILGCRRPYISQSQGIHHSGSHFNLAHFFSGTSLYKNKLGLEEWPNFKACTSTLLSCRDYKLPVLLFKAEQIQIRLTVLFYQAWSASHTFFSEKYHPCNLEVYLEEYSRQMQPPLTASVALCVFSFTSSWFLFLEHFLRIPSRKP